MVGRTDSASDSHGDPLLLCPGQDIGKALVWPCFVDTEGTDVVIDERGDRDESR